MFQISFLYRNRDKIILGLKKRNFKKIYLIDEILSLYKKKKQIQTHLNKILQQENLLSRKVSKLILIDENKLEIEKIKNKSIILKKEKKNINYNLKNILFSIDKKLSYIPNIPDKKLDNNTKICFQTKQINKLIKNPLPHWELTKKFNLFDIKLGNNICGSGFPVYLDKCAKLQRCLIQYFLDINIKSSYKEYQLPYIINEHSGFTTGQIPDKEHQMYYIEKDKFYLIPTGEIPLMNCYRNIIFEEKELPIKSTTYTVCFRREAGSYGSKVRGLNRLHQFDKVEIIQICTPNYSSNSLKEMILHVKNILKNLQLPFRIILLRGSDLSHSSSITYDFEVYSIAQNKWFEVSSISNCTDFQSNRLNLKYKIKKTGRKELCHTLNGSSLAIQRVLLTLLENNQTKNKIHIPKVLIPYTGFDSIK